VSRRSSSWQTLLSVQTQFAVASVGCEQDKDESLPAYSTQGSGSDVIVIAQARRMRCNDPNQEEVNFGMG
jgi:hypothetical protein